ncbi:MAG: CCA tRNA nucleotidyltransferase [Minisyncoccales bacterium]
MKEKIPKQIIQIIKKLKKHGFQSFIVGGCVRDLLRKEKPADWDIATDARPEEILKIFPHSYYDNKFFTVCVQTKSKDFSLKEIEITTFRKEGKYENKRHPSEISFAQTIEEDLSRRDFTINAMALDMKNLKNQKEYQIIDPFNGQADLEKKIIRAVRDPKERFNEDALRMLRAVRLLVVLNQGWKIEEKTFQAIKELSHLLNYISGERIRDEFEKIILSSQAVKGIEVLRESGLLKYIVPELLEGYLVSQNKHHIFDCWTHSLKSLEFACQKNFSLEVRLAALFHDIGKPRTKKGEGPNATFYGHEIVGAKMTEKILQRLKFPKKQIEKIVKLVRYHLFYYNVGEVGEASVRKLLRNVGKENIEELIQLRMADRIGSGVPKAEPYKLRHLRYTIEKISKDPLSVKMLKVNGHDVMERLKIQPSPKIGQILNILLKEIIEDKSKNKKSFLLKRIEELGRLNDNDLLKMAIESKKKIEAIETKTDQMTKKKYWVF